MKWIIYSIIFLLSFSLVSCSHLFYQPTREFYANPLPYGLVVDDVLFPSNDGTELHAWYIKGLAGNTTPRRGLICFFHGNGENLTSHWRAVAWLVAKGYNIFIVDYRGYGLSKGTPDQFSVNQDALSTLNKAWEIAQQDKLAKFIVYGQSLGGVISMRSIFDFAHRDKIDLLIQESTFSSYRELAFDKLKSHWLTFLLSPLAYVLVSDEMQSKSYVAKWDRPLLVINGSVDEVVPTKFGKEIYDLATSVPKGKKWYWEVPGANHIASFWVHADKDYRQLLVDLLLSL